MPNTAVTTNSRRRWFALVLVVLVAACCWQTFPTASAHAAYESSTPQFGEVLSQPPSTISIRFTQELFRRDGANRITLTSAASGNDIRLGELEIGNQDRHLMSVAILEELPAGRYLAAWRNLSAEDGDADSGSYPFYVGRSPSRVDEAADRLNAAELLITYPGDEAEPPSGQTAAPQRAPAVVRAQSADAPSLGLGSIVWLVAGIGAALILAGSFGVQLGRRRTAR